MTLANKLSVVSAGMLALMQANATNWGVQEVKEGPYDLIGGTPTIVVTPDSQLRSFAGAAGIQTLRTQNDYRLIILFHHCRFQSMEMNFRQCMERAELVVDKIHEDKTLGGLVINGMVTQQQTGVTGFRQTLLMSTRITWEGMTRNIE